MSTPPSTNATRSSLLTAAYYLSFIMLGLLTAAEGPALPGLAQNTSSTLDQISLIFVFGALGYLLGSLFSGYVYDRLPGHHVIAMTFSLISVCTALVPFMHKLGTLLLVLFVLGIAKGALDVGCNTLLMWVHGVHAGPFMNGLHFFFGLGALGAPLILAQVLSLTGGILGMFWLFATLSLPMAVWLWRLAPPAAGNASPEESAKPFPVFPVALLVLALLLYVGAEIGYGNWIYTYALTIGLATDITAAYLTSAFWGAFTIGRLLGVWVSARLRPATILLADLAGSLASLALILLWPGSTQALWVGTILLGACMASIFPTTLLLAGEHMRVSGAMTGWFLMGASLGGMSLPWAIGQAFVRVGARAMPVLVTGTLVANLSVIVLYNYRSRLLITSR